MTTLTGDLFLGAKRVRGSGEAFHARNPRTGERLDPAFARGGRDDVDRAAALAWEAFPAYRAADSAARAALLTTVADNLETVAEDLVTRVMAETGIVEPRVRGELARTTGQLRLFARVVRDGSWHGARLENALPDRVPLPRPDLRQRRIPLGPIAVFGASNFPLAFSVAGGDTASALAAGCPVVVKAHPSHPGTSEITAAAVAAAVAECGLPEGVFSLVHGDPDDVAIPLATHPHIRAVGFTGSRAAGQALVAAAASRPVPIPVYAEMSSINPVILLPGALEQRAEALAEGFVASLTTGVGQLCTSPGLVLALDCPALDRFLDSAAEAVRGNAAGVMLNDAICRSYRAGVDRLGASEGVELLAIADPDDTLVVGGSPALFTATAAALRPESPILEENFGASSVVVRIGDPDQLTEIIGSLEGQLTLTVHAAEQDLSTARALLPQLELKAGRIVFNGWPTGVEVGEAMVHGGPYPATSDGRSTSVGTLAIERFLRPVAYQDCPAELLPEPVDDANSLGLWRQVNGEFGKK